MNEQLTTVAQAIAHCERHRETDKDTEIVNWLADSIGDLLKSKYPRFNVGEWRAVSLPVRSAHLRGSILAKIAS